MMWGWKMTACSHSITLEILWGVFFAVTVFNNRCSFTHGWRQSSQSRICASVFSVVWYVLPVQDEAFSSTRPQNGLNLAFLHLLSGKPEKKTKKHKFNDKTWKFISGICFVLVWYKSSILMTKWKRHTIKMSSRHSNFIIRGLTVCFSASLQFSI